MKTTLIALALATTLAQPAAAITFPSLTTIYVGSGVYDNGQTTDEGFAAAFTCSNVSGVTAQVRWLVLGFDGVSEGNRTATLPHGSTRTAVTHMASTLVGDFNLATGEVSQGVVNIESTQSGVLCSAVALNASDGTGYTLALVRVNPHPGTVE
jgi:hypothetical protein